MPASITLEEMIAEFERLSKRADDRRGWTSSEIRQQTGWSINRVDHFIDNALAAGLMQCVQEMRTDRSGVTRRRPVYVWVKERRSHGVKRKKG